MGEKKRKRREKEELTVIQQLRIWGFWRSILAEFIGSYFYVLIVCETLVALRTSHAERHRCQREVQSLPTDLAYGCVTGLTAMSMSWTLSDVSGGHVNPAITCTMLLTRRISLHAAACYVMAQCAGAVAASATLFGLTGNEHVGVTVIHPHLTTAQAIGVEMLITFLYVFSFFASLDKHRSFVPGGSLIAFGSSVTAAATFGVPFTGSGLNPARSLGPAVIERFWEKHWIYWAGPIIGGAIGGLMYDVIFAGNASMRRVKALFYDPKYNCDSSGSVVEINSDDQDQLSANLSQKLRDIEEDENYFSDIRRQKEFGGDEDADSLYLATFKDISDPVSRHVSNETLEMFDRIAAV